MVKKLNLYVCAEIGCPKVKVTSKPEDCPTHGRPFVKRVYVMEETLAPRKPFDFGSDLGDVLDSLFGSKRKSS